MALIPYVPSRPVPPQPQLQSRAATPATTVATLSSVACTVAARLLQLLGDSLLAALLDGERALSRRPLLILLVVGLWASVIAVAALVFFVANPDLAWAAVGALLRLPFDYARWAGGRIRGSPDSFRASNSSDANFGHGRGSDDGASPLSWMLCVIACILCWKLVPTVGPQPALHHQTFI